MTACARCGGDVSTTVGTWTTEMVPGRFCSHKCLAAAASDSLKPPAPPADARTVDTGYVRIDPPDTAAAPRCKVIRIPFADGIDEPPAAVSPRTCVDCGAATGECARCFPCDMAYLKRQGKLPAAVSPGVEAKVLHVDITEPLSFDVITREERDALRARLAAAEQRANRLADEAGTLRAENDELLRENARLRRELERARRGR